MKLNTPFKDNVSTNASTKPSTAGKSDPVGLGKASDAGVPTKQTEDIKIGESPFKSAFTDVVRK